MNRTPNLLGAVAVALAATGASAQSSFDYTYLRGALGGASLDDPDENFGAASLGASFELADSGFRVFVGNNAVFGDVGAGFGLASSTTAGSGQTVVERGRDLDYRSNALAVGGGYHLSLNDTTDLAFDVAWLSAEAEIETYIGDFDLDDSAIDLSAGVRTLLTPRLELAAGIHRTTWDESDDDTSFSAGLVMQATEKLSVTFAAGGNDDSVSYLMGVRYHFRN